MPEDMKKPDGDEIEIKLQNSNDEAIKDSKLYRWLDNYWYHYKWHTIITVGVILLLIFCIAPMFGKTPADVMVVYCGPYWFEETAQDFQETMNRVMPKDFNGDGEKYTEIVRYQVYSEEELTSTPTGTVNLSYNADQLKNFKVFFSTGEAAIYFISEDMYESMKPRNVFRPLSDIFEKTPEIAYDDCAVRVKDIPSYALEPSLQKLPEDTLVCMTTPFDIGDTSKPELYANAEAMFHAIVLGK